MITIIIITAIWIGLIPFIFPENFKNEYLSEKYKYECAVFNEYGNTYQTIWCFVGITSNVNDKLILINPEEEPNKCFAVLKEKDADIKVYDIFHYTNEEVISILKENNEKTINTTIFNLLISGEETKQILGINLYKLQKE